MAQRLYNVVKSFTCMCSISSTLVCRGCPLRSGLVLLTCCPGPLLYVFMPNLFILKPPPRLVTTPERWMIKAHLHCELMYHGYVTLCGGRRCAPQSCPAALKLVPKAVPQSCSQKSSPKATPQNYPIITENCSTKFLVNVCLKAAVLQSKWSSKLFRKVVQSCSPKLLPKAVPRSCSPKLFPSAAVQSYCPEAAIFQVYTPKWFPKAAPQSCC